MWLWVSMRPGTTKSRGPPSLLRPVKAASTSVRGPTEAMRPPSTATAPSRNTRRWGSAVITVPVMTKSAVSPIQAACLVGPSPVRSVGN